MAAKEEAPENSEEMDRKIKRMYRGYALACQRINGSEYPEPEWEAVKNTYETYMSTRKIISNLYHAKEILLSREFYEKQKKNISE